MMRLENETCSTPCKNPLTDVSAMFHASVIQEGIKMENDYKKLEREANDASMNSVMYHFCTFFSLQNVYR